MRKSNLFNKKKSESLPPGQRAIDKIMRWYVDHPGISNTPPRIDLSNWSLNVDGLVEKPLKLNWKEFLKLPSFESVSDFHCVEGWSVKDCRWEGVRFTTLIETVKPKEEGKYVWFECADNYTTSLTIEDLLGDSILLAYRLNGESLPLELGGPMRLIAPDKYAYKSPMWITKITFTDKKQLGYWEQRGYSDTADVWKNDRRAF